MNARRRFPVVLRAPADAVDLRLDQLLARELPRETGLTYSRRRARADLAEGVVFLRGRVVRVASRRVAPRARIEVWLEDRDGLVPVVPVLYQDADLLAVDKPAGLPSQAMPGDAVRHLLTAAASVVGLSSGRSPYLALHHRLDRGTSGVVLLARSRRANRGLAAAFASRRVEKTYLALVWCERQPPTSWTVRNRLASRRNGDRSVMRPVESGGREAVSSFRLLDSWGSGPDGRAWVEARPHTGRTHQLRVHLSGSGFPVVGDRKYGRSDDPATRLFLHAHRLELEHPVHHEPLVVESPRPSTFSAVRG